MRILVIPDLHENLDFLKYIMSIEDSSSFDHIVLLGDYFDSHSKALPSLSQVQRVAGTLFGYKELLGDKLHLLCGNHDLPYYALRPACLLDGGAANLMIGEWLEATTMERAEVINELWDEAFWQQLRGAVLLDGWLFSHAGVHPHHWNAGGATLEARYAQFEYNWDRDFARIHQQPENEPDLFAIGRARRGTTEFAGPLWLDWNEEFEDSLEVPQVVGHTSCANPTQKGRSYCLDFAQAAYAIIENGDLQLNIWPQSWLGEEMLDSV
jgi:hypothetical protein